MLVFPVFLRMPVFTWETDLQNTSHCDMASPQFLACSGYHHRRPAAYGLHAENHWSGDA